MINSLDQLDDDFKNKLSYLFARLPIGFYIGYNNGSYSIYHASSTANESKIIFYFLNGHSFIDALKIIIEKYDLLVRDSSNKNDGLKYFRAWIDGCEPGKVPYK